MMSSKINKKFDVLDADVFGDSRGAGGRPLRSAEFPLVDDGAPPTGGHMAPVEINAMTSPTGGAGATLLTP